MSYLIYKITNKLNKKTDLNSLLPLAIEFKNAILNAK